MGEKGTAGVAIQVAGRVVRREVRKSSGMLEGLIWVEAYLPLDLEAYSVFVSKMVKGGLSAVQVAAEHPELAQKALTPIDSHGQGMLPEDVLELAHGFMQHCRKIDVMHDGQARTDVVPVQSFVNTPEIASPHFWPGAWVTVLKIDTDSNLFPLVDNNTLDGVSFQCWIINHPVTINLEAAAQL